MATLEEIDEVVDVDVAHNAGHDTTSAGCIVSTPRFRSFRELYEGICNRIRSSGYLDNIMKEFEMFSNDYERVQFAAGLQEIQYLEISRIPSDKDAEAATALQENFDILIVDETNAPEALQVITHSLKLTPAEDEISLALRYMKRGWASLLMENFEAAKIDAERCLKFEVPPNMVWNAHEILGHCHAKASEFRAAEQCFQRALSSLRVSDASNEIKALAAGRIALVFKTVKGRKDTKAKTSQSTHEKNVLLPNVAFGQHPYLVSATEAVELVIDDLKGRCLVATKDFTPGDVIIVEKPFAASLNHECFDSHCSACFKRLNVTCVPCSTCSMVWFCNEKCRDNIGPHRQECGILSYFNDEAISKMATLVFRILTEKGYSELLANKEDYMKVLNKQNLLSEARSTCWNGKQKYMSHDYETVFHLVTNDDKRSFGDLFKRSITAIYLSHCLKAVNFFGTDPVEDDFLYIASLALRHLQGASCNAYDITEYVAGPRGPAASKFVEIGGAIYPTISLTNHSCWPNVSRYSVGTSCVLRATRSIQKGDKIWDNYGKQFLSSSLGDRQEYLRTQYKFDCDCEACINDWPIYPHRKEPLVFKCPEPDCERLVAFQDGKDERCPMCGGTKKYGDLKEQIGFKLSDFGRCLRSIKEGKPEKAIKGLIEHHLFLEKHAVPPSKFYSDSQEAIRQCFTCLGNSHYLT